MPGNDIIELYENDGAVYRRVRKDLGAGRRVVTSDTMEHPDIKEFLQEQPDAKVRGYHPETDKEYPSPERFTLAELEDFLDQVESVDVLLKMRELDDRKTADGMYEDRITELVMGEDEEEEEELSDDI